MIKLTFCLVRLPHLSREAFQNYWYGTHAPLVASVAETLQSWGQEPSRVQDFGVGMIRFDAAAKTS